MRNIDAILNGLYDGVITYGELKDYGDFGVPGLGITCISSRRIEKQVGTYLNGICIATMKMHDTGYKIHDGVNIISKIIACGE